MPANRPAAPDSKNRRPEATSTPRAGGASGNNHRTAKLGNTAKERAKRKGARTRPMVSVLDENLVEILLPSMNAYCDSFEVIDDIISSSGKDGRHHTVAEIVCRIAEGESVDVQQMSRNVFKVLERRIKHFARALECAERATRKTDHHDVYDLISGLERINLGIENVVQEYRAVHFNKTQQSPAHKVAKVPAAAPKNVSAKPPGRNASRDAGVLPTRGVSAVQPAHPVGDSGRDNQLSCRTQVSKGSMPARNENVKTEHKCADGKNRGPSANPPACSASGMQVSYCIACPIAMIKEHARRAARSRAKWETHLCLKLDEDLVKVLVPSVISMGSGTNGYNAIKRIIEDRGNLRLLSRDRYLNVTKVGEAVALRIANGGPVDAQQMDRNVYEAIVHKKGHYEEVLASTTKGTDSDVDALIEGLEHVLSGMTRATHEYETRAILKTNGEPNMRFMANKAAARKRGATPGARNTNAVPFP